MALDARSDDDRSIDDGSGYDQDGYDRDGFDQAGADGDGDGAEVAEGIEQSGRPRVEATGFVAAPPSEVWALWTEPDELARWWWPMFDDTRYELDPREGGWYRFRTAEGGFGVQGSFVELVPGERLVLTWDWLAGQEAAAPTELVTVVLEELDDGTLVRVSQTARADEVEQLEQGWSDTLTRLEELLDD